MALGRVLKPAEDLLSLTSASLDMDLLPLAVLLGKALIALFLFFFATFLTFLDAKVSPENACFPTLRFGVLSKFLVDFLDAKAVSDSMFYFEDGVYFLLGDTAKVNLLSFLAFTDLRKPWSTSLPILLWVNCK